MKHKHIYVCPACHFTGVGKTSGSFMIELILWCAFIVPGLIYSCWRMTQKHRDCPSCRSRGMIPYDSPRGKELSKETPEAVDQMARKLRRNDIIFYIAVTCLIIFLIGLSKSN